MENIESKKYVSAKEKVFFSLGDVFGGAGGMITAVYTVFLAMNGLRPWMWGTIFLVARIVDAITDPLVGAVSDNTRNPLGRRRPFLILGGILMIASMFFLFMPLGLWMPNPDSLNFRFVLYLVAFVFFSIVSTLCAVPYSAMLNEITPNPKERNKINAMRLVASMLSAALSALVPMLLIEQLRAGGTATLGVFSSIMIGVFGMLYSICVICSGVFSKERVAVPKERPKFSVKAFLKPLKLKPFIYLVIIYFAAFVSLDLITANIIFLADYALNLSIVPPFVLLAIIMVSYGIMLPVHTYLMKKYPKALLYRVGIPVYILGLAILTLFPAETGALEWLLIPIALLIGIGLSGCQLMPWFIYPDVVDLGELKWGERNAGAYSGIMTFIRKATAGFAIFLSGIVLEAAGFIPREVDPLTGQFDTIIQTQPAQWALRLVVLVPVMVFVVMAGIVSFKLKFTPKNTSLVAKVLEMRRKGEQEALSAEESQDLETIKKAL